MPESAASPLGNGAAAKRNLYKASEMKGWAAHRRHARPCERIGSTAPTAPSARARRHVRGKPSSGDATLDALVRDLSAKVRATDGRWVEENAPKDGAKSIYDDFEGAIASAPRIDGTPGGAVQSAADALEEQLAAFDAGGVGSAGVPIVDIESMDDDAMGAMLGGGGAAAEFNSFADDIVAMMLRHEEKKRAEGGPALGEAIGSDQGGGLAGKFDAVARDGGADDRGGTRGGDGSWRV